jgi:hypothetical protein
MTRQTLQKSLKNIQTEIRKWKREAANYDCGNFGRSGDPQYYACERILEDLFAAEDKLKDYLRRYIQCNTLEQKQSSESF